LVFFIHKKVDLMKAEKSERQIQMNIVDKFFQKKLFWFFTLIHFSSFFWLWKTKVCDQKRYFWVNYRVYNHSKKFNDYTEDDFQIANQVRPLQNNQSILYFYSSFFSLSRLIYKSCIRLSMTFWINFKILKFLSLYFKLQFHS